MGKHLKTYSITNKGQGKLTIDGSELRNGIYTCKFVSDNKIISTNKLVIIK